MGETRKSTRTRKAKTAANSVEKKKKPSPLDPTTAKRKREERLRRNRESANRSRIRKKKEMHELKENVVLLREKVVTLTNRIEELEESNQGLREKLAMYKKPGHSYKPAVTVFALVFTVAFFAQPSTVAQAGFARLPGQGASKVMGGLGKFGQGSKTFLLAPFIDLFSNSAIDSALSMPVLPTIISIVSKVFIALILATVCALLFHYFGSLRQNENRDKNDNTLPHVYATRELILDRV